LNWLLFRRRVLNGSVLFLSVLATIFGLIWLVWILWTTFEQGLKALNLDLFRSMTPPPGESGGLLNAFYGSFLMIGIAVLVGTPIGVLAGTFLAEFARKKHIGSLIRFVNDILLSAPSIVIGLFVYQVMVRPMGHFSGWAGSIALALILLPVVVRTTDESLKLIPAHLREAALSLGIPYWKVVTRVIYRGAFSGILTGILLAISRIAGETAPLLFTALNNQYWSTSPNTPMANLPVVIFQFAMSPYENWQRLPWAGAFVVTIFVLLLSIGTRILLTRRKF